MKPSEESLQKAAQCWCDPTTSNRVMDEALAKVFAQKLDEAKEVKVGGFVLTQVGYADEFWISRVDGEGMALNANNLAELEKLLSDFYSKHF